MALSSRVLWGEGMFLRPQHFQQQALHFEHLLRDGLHANCAAPWGVRGIEIDTEALQAGFLRANRLEVLFPDGTAFAAPAAEPLPLQRNLNDLPQLGVETLVYACLPAIDAFGGNCGGNYGGNCAGSGTGSGEPAAARPVRYAVGQRSVPDLYSQALEAEIAVLQANVRLMTEEENRDGYLSLPVARLKKAALGNWALDDGYLPPLARIGASPALLTALRRLLDILQVKSQSLAATHRERVQNVVEYGTSDIASFWLLHTVNRNFPLLNHLLHHPAAHPEALYQELAQLAGELLTFSSSLGLAEIPVYRHDQLTQVFAKLDGLIRELLGTVISNRYVAIPLENTKPSFFVAQLESDRLLEGADFYLSVSAETPITGLVETVPIKLKVGAPDDVERILNSALAGVRLNHAAQTPAAVPVRVGNHYFSFEPSGAIFERMLKSRSICLYVPQSLKDIKLELIAVFR